VGAPDGRVPGPQGRDLTQAPGLDALGVVQRIGASLAAGGFKVSRDSVAGRQAVIGRRGRIGGAGSTSPAFVLVAVFKSDASPEHLDRFLDEAGQYASTVKGRLRPGACAVAVAVVDSGADAGAWAMTAPARRQGVRAFPVLVDLGTGGVVWADHGADLRHVVEAHVVPSVRRA
jgi:hypothetical protein